jgi:hypothetical protein
MECNTISEKALLDKYFHLRSVSRKLIKVYDSGVLDYHGRISLGNMIMSISYKWMLIEKEMEIRFADSGLKTDLEILKNFNQK